MIHINLAHEYKKKHDNDVAAGFFGIYIAFIQALKFNKNDLKRAIELTKDPNGPEMIKESKLLRSTLKNLLEENQKVY